MKRAPKSARVLLRCLNARQFGLKLIANVTYGYTAAGFSGGLSLIGGGGSSLPVHTIVMRQTATDCTDFTPSALLTTPPSFWAPFLCAGRMPMAELADAIVQSGRETLESAIRLVEAHPEWRAQVLYGDTGGRVADNYAENATGGLCSWEAWFCPPACPICLPCPKAHLPALPLSRLVLLQTACLCCCLGGRVRRRFASVQRWLLQSPPPTLPL